MPQYTTPFAYVAECGEDIEAVQRGLLDYYKENWQNVRSEFESRLPELANFGARLAGLHLLKSPELDPPTCQFEGKGDARVAKTKAQGFRYDADDQCLYINRTQYFGQVPGKSMSTGSAATRSAKSG
ncbi:MAG: hypothetical protein OXH63_09410 [Gemmatimonadetes bacterium]|nr:hypothetical protein [Gemmatimonadota bacterium]